MKTIKSQVNLLGGLLAAIVTCLAQSVVAQTNQHVRMYIIPVSGPQFADPAFAGWAQGVVSNIYSSNPPGSNVGYYLNTSYFAADLSRYPSPFTNSTVRFALRVTAVNPGYMFTPNDLLFTERSSDALLDYRFVYTNPIPSYIAYTPQAIGVVRGIDGSVSAVYTNFENWSNMVSEFIFIGPQSRCYEYGTNVSISLQYSYTDLSDYLDSVSDQITGTWSIDDGVNLIASASKTFYRFGTPANVSLGIRALGGTNYQISFVSSSNDTWTVQESPTIAGFVIWRDIFTASGAVIVNWSSTNICDFFRGVLQ